MEPPALWDAEGAADRLGGHARRPRRTLGHVARRRQISTVFYPRKRRGDGSGRAVVHSRRPARSAPMPSETDASTQARSDLPDAAIRAELESILASQVFSRSQQLRRFLSFIVEQRLAGQGQTLKESVLAHELYGKGTDFDGGADPVVRVDARRLRDKLREYYEGRFDPVVITLPKGGYVPVFEANSASPTHTPPPVVHAEPEQQQTPPVPNFRLTRIAVSALAIVAAIVAAALAWRALARPVSAPIQLLPLASYQGVEGPPALSPDGDLVAFAWSGDRKSTR